MASRSSPLMASRTASILSLIESRVEASTPSPRSLRDFSEESASDSALLRTSISSWVFRSASAFISASWTIWSIWSRLRLPEPEIVMDCLAPVPFSCAETWRMPFLSMSSVTSICGTRGRCGRDAREVESTKALVVARHRPLPLEDVDLHLGLVVGGGGVDAAPLRRDRRVALDKLVEDAALRLDAERERGHVHEDDILAELAGDDARPGSRRRRRRPRRGSRSGSAPCP